MRNYLIGFGERLVQPVSIKGPGGPKRHPYTFEQARQRLAPQFAETIRAVSALPPMACPGDEAVVALALNPAYLAKSYFPEVLLRETGLRSVGSHAVHIAPSEPPSTPKIRTARPTIGCLPMSFRPRRRRYSSPVRGASCARLGTPSGQMRTGPPRRRTCGRSSGSVRWRRNACGPCQETSRCFPSRWSCTRPPTAATPTSSRASAPGPMKPGPGPTWTCASRRAACASCPCAHRATP